jgi:hypothetical protein
MIDVPCRVDCQVGFDSRNLRFHSEVRDGIARITGGGRRGHPAFGISQRNVGDRLARLQLNVGSAQRRAIDGRLGLLVVGIELVLGRSVEPATCRLADAL